MFARRSFAASPGEYEKELIRKDGSAVPVSLRVWGFTGDDGRIAGMRAFVRDITERKKAEAALRENQALVKAVIEQSADAIFVKDREGRMLLANPACLAAIGKPAEQVIGKTDQEFLSDPEDARAIMANDRRVMETGQTEVFLDETVLTPAGPRCFRNTKTPYRDAAGNVIGIVGVARDISEVKATEFALRRSELRHRTLVETTSVITWSCPPSGLHVEPQPEWMAFTGQTAEEMLGDGWGRAVHPDDASIAASTWLEAVNWGEHYKGEFRIRRHDGQWRWMSVQAVPIRGLRGDIVEWFGTNADITEVKATEAALRRSELRYRTLVEATSATTWSCAPSGLQGAPLAEWMAFTGQTADEALGDGWSRAVYPDDLSRATSTWREVANAAEPYKGELRIRRQDGQWRWVRVEAAPICDLRGEIVEWFGMTADITERKEAETALRASEEKFRALAQAIPSFLWETDAEGSNTFMSDAWCDYTGMAEADAAGIGWAGVLHPEDRERIYREWTAGIAPPQPLLEFRYRMRAADGSYRWFLSRGVPFRNSEGEVVRWVGSSTDIDELVKAQSDLAESDRRKDEFLATLAHELRNPLVPIRNAAYVLKRRHFSAGPEGEMLDMIERKVDHLTRLVDELLEVSRISRGIVELRKENVALADCLRDALESCQPFIREQKHRLIVKAADELLRVFGDPVRLAQIAANIIGNAAKYTAPGGVIEIETARVQDEAVLIVRDDGVGIDEELLPRIFELFVHSGARGGASKAGLGIGLALVRKLVELHGGSVTAKSDGVGCGSEFVVRLPLGRALAAEVEPPETSVATGESAPRALIVDDDRDVANSFRFLLVALGAEVRCAYDGLSGIAALDVFEPDVIFLDIGMPEIDGYETARRIVSLRPERRFTLVALTGWGQKEDRRRAQEAGFDLHLTKPASVDAVQDLLQRVRAAGAEAAGAFFGERRQRV